ncbi:heme-binding protein [Paenibacillus frigoriresistens]|nr:heme-binding protein [Paenibacillus frigoriresistens]
MVMKMIEICVKKADEFNIFVNISVMDDGGNLKGFLRMDQAALMNGQISRNKAYTAVGLGIPTADWYPKIKDMPELLHGLVHTDNMVVFGGGLPIYIDSQLVGGIGVSGGTCEQDDICAQAALDEVLGDQKG